ncbi:carbohydrate-binding module family 48 protein, partial [Pluteus cervinus]
MSDLHEVVFQWPHTEPNSVIVTGSFDQWRSSIPLTKGPFGYEARVQVPWGQKVPYKYIVDGRWKVRQSQPTEYDPIGNLNNVYLSPTRP